MSVGQFVQKLYFKLFKRARDEITGLLDRHRDTRAYYDACLTLGVMNVERFSAAKINLREKKYLASQYLAHRFDLLGSGWVKVSYDSIYRGVEGNVYSRNIQNALSYEGIVKTQLRKSHRVSAFNIAKFIDCNYLPVDWQVDFKSGYRWKESISSHQQKIGVLTGVDIKVPWELARLQHLPQLAIFCLEEGVERYRYIREIRNQVLDFIAMNPPRMGVNWIYSMDVAIRAANMLVAVDMGRQFDDKDILDDKFIEIFSSSIFEHGQHIVNNLEYSPELTSNHYMANICGLAFISVYLKESTMSNLWLAFALQEIISEVDRQFYRDGGSFEGSSCYHRLTTEMVVYSYALFNGLSPQRLECVKNINQNNWKKFPKLKSYVDQKYQINKGGIEWPCWFEERMSRACQYTRDISKQNGNVVQFGDNDSGRFFRFSVAGEFMTNEEAELQFINLKGYNNQIKLYDVDPETKGIYFGENSLNHCALISAFEGLFATDTEFSEGLIEEEIIQSLSNNKVVSQQYVAQIRLMENELFNIEKFRYSNRVEVKLRENHCYDLLSNINIFTYPMSGIIVIKSDHLYLALLAIPAGLNGNGGHNHNDQMSLELTMDGVDIWRDPGSYLYTSNPAIRNKFRSVSAHNTMIGTGEPNFLFEEPDKLFMKLNESRCTFSRVGITDFSMDLKYREFCQRRTVHIGKRSVFVVDSSNKPFKSNFSSCERFSSGYGKLSISKFPFSKVEIKSL